MRYKVLGSANLTILRPEGDDRGMTDAEPRLTFPELEVRSLTGVHWTLPRDLPVPRTLVVCAFRQWHQRLVDEWIEWAVREAGVAPTPRGLADGTETLVIEVPVLGRRYRPARGFIDGGMTAGIRVPDVLARTFTAYTDVRAFCAAAGIGSTETVTAFVVQPDGAVLARVTGPVEEVRCAEVARALAGQGVS